MDEHFIRDNCRRYLAAFRKNYPEVEIAFAGKAFMTAAMSTIVGQEGLYQDVTTAGEIHTARVAGYPMEKVIFHGNNKSVEELQMALDLEIGRIVVDNFQELELLNKLAGACQKRASILLRLTPGIDPHTHKLIRTGQEDTKFGFNIKDGSATLAVKQSLEYANIELLGLHCHVGSQLLDTTAHEQAIRIMVRFMADVQKTGFTSRELNIGGGLGIRYLSTHKPPTIEEFAEKLTTLLKRQIKSHGIEAPKLMLEPGRSIVGEAGTTLYQIGTIKRVTIKKEPGFRIYVSVDGGLSDNPRPALYDAKYEAIIANKAKAEADAVVTIAGKHCETDTLIEDTRIADPTSGDLLAVYSTGAYNYSMASNYNRQPRPAVVLVSDGKADVVVRRETIDDLVRQDVIPERFNTKARS
jgi:diaminopimelate decarboxylase